jgi:5-carboxymethyl-2-hydroxymuconic-semialdehyde dehydrogenase
MDKVTPRSSELFQFSGMKSSGVGRDGGDYSFDFYMETKHVSLARGTHEIQKLGV